MSLNSSKPSCTTCLRRGTVARTSERILPRSPEGRDACQQLPDVRTEWGRRTDAVERSEEVTHRPRHADELEELGRRLAPGALQATVLNEDLAHSLALLRGEDVDDGV